MTKVTFRPHHFLCALCFQGRGYSPVFIANFQSIMQSMTDETSIQVVSHTDSICKPCPHRMGKTCETEQKIAVLDKAHATALAIQPGDIITWGEAKQRIKEKITLDQFHALCATCSWKASGICEKVIVTNTRISATI